MPPWCRTGLFTIVKGFFWSDDTASLAEASVAAATGCFSGPLALTSQPCCQHHHDVSCLPPAYSSNLGALWCHVVQVGDHQWLQRQHESRLMPALVTASIATLMGLCWAATPATWAHFGFLFSHSKAIHVMLIDLTLLTLMSPWLVVADARARGVAFAQNPTGAVLLGLAMLAVPMIGPGVYLLLRPITPGQGVGFSGRRGRAVGAADTPAWLSHVWPFKSVTAGGSQITAAAAAAKGRAVRGARQLRDTTAGAGSSAAAAGRSAAANVVAAASVPLPSGVGVRSAAEGAAGAAGFATGAVCEGLARGWARFKRGANRFLSGGYPHLATATRTGSMDEVFIDYDGESPALTL